MDEQANKRIVQQVYETFRGGEGADMTALLRTYADDVEWTVPDMENVRIGGRRQGVASVREFFAAVADDLDLLQFEPQEFIAQGERVVALGRYAWRVKATGREFSSDWAHVYTVRDGKIVRFHEYMDTAAEIKAHQKRSAGAAV